MRRALILSGALLSLAGCPLPEDQFVLSGQLLNGQGAPMAGAEVRLLRNQVASETRCDALEPLQTTVTDSAGRYSFTLIRQEITRGISARRFFRVEADAFGAVVSQTFWFPDADLDLGVLSLVQPSSAWRITEWRIDDRLGWRSEFNGFLFSPDRPFSWRTASTSREWRSVPIDSLGRYDIVPVEWRNEGGWISPSPGNVPPPPSRGAECPQLDVTPCPLTDGRYLPFEFPPNTRNIVLNFKRETQVNPLAFHGLMLERRAVRARLEFNIVEDFSNWNILGTRTLDPRLQELSAERCNDPGTFVSFGASSFIKPFVLRVTFEDEAGDAVPIISLAEISSR